MTREEADELFKLARSWVARDHSYLKQQHPRSASVPYRIAGMEQQDNACAQELSELVAKLRSQ